MRKIVLMIALLAVLGACARAADRRDDGGPFEHDRGPEIVVRLEYTGGLVPASHRYRSLPAFTLYGDGRIVSPGGQPAMYPSPALPELAQQTITEAGIQAILSAARDAGLTRGDRTVGQPPGVAIADAGFAVFTVVAGGKRSVTRVDALGAVEESGERKKIEDFRTLIVDADRTLPKGTVGPLTTYEFGALRVVVLPYTATPAPNVRVARQEWPLVQPLSAFGRQVEPGVRCGFVRDGDFDRLLPKVRESSEITPWTSEGETYQLVVRPVLPGETGC